MDLLNALKKNIVLVILVAIILIAFAPFILITGNKPPSLPSKCDAWFANPDAVFENVIYDSKNKIITPFLANTGDKDIYIVSIGVNYELKGQATEQEVYITLTPHSGQFIEISADREPNRIVILTDKPCEEIAMSKPEEGWNTVRKATSSSKCDAWVANPDAVFENVTYDSKNNIITPLLKNTGDKDIHIKSIGVNYEIRGPVTEQEVNITAEPHTSKFIEIPTSKEPNRIVILTDKPCEEIAMSKPEEGWNTVFQEK